MLRKRLTTSALTVLLACAALSCAPDSQSDSLLGPPTSDVTQVQSQDSTAAQRDSAQAANETTQLIPMNAADLLAQGYTLIKEPAPTQPSTLFGWLIDVVEATIALLLGSDGGILTLLGHILNVPAGAVSEPTLFSMTVIQNGYVEVELTATPKSLLRSLFFWRKAEEVQFNVPVGLSLSYARATNVTDPSRLKIMRVNPDGNHEILPSVVDTVNKTVTAELDHFSRYCMIAN